MPQGADKAQKRHPEPQPAPTVTAADLFSTEELLEDPRPPMEHSGGSRLTSLRDSSSDSPRDCHHSQGQGCKRPGWQEASSGPRKVSHAAPRELVHVAPCCGAARLGVLVVYERHG